ncbi:MAG: glutamine synthetase family protein [Bacteroidales bacterium]|jgi:glutamine synthetase|nr:glutamine synthetase family protein [Bacteroidales bacterium]
MKDRYVNLNPNELVKFLDKPAKEFQRDDLIRFIETHDIEMLNFRYIAEDGKLKTLSFVIHSREHLQQILTFGERVDGSSLFSFVSAGSSDLYVIPRYRTAFVNPFSEIPTLDILCSFYTSEGKPLENATEYILRKSQELFKARTGMKFKALGELEYYINSPKDGHFQPIEQKGYHESSPLSKWEHLRNEALTLIARAGGKVKYSHNEVGVFYSSDELFEQHEIEFLPCDVEEAADQLVLAKWILRKLADKYNAEISFAPKISEGAAGSGLHIHMMAQKDGKNMLSDSNGLTETARKMIAGVLDMSDALTAFGNTIPTSYLRLVPEQEAPTKICWGDRNRSVLVRVPLGWLGKNNMINDANPCEPEIDMGAPGRQTFEFRAPDGSADIHSLLAGLVLSSLHGIEMNDSLSLAESLYVQCDIHKNKDKYLDLKHLPDSCYVSAEALNKKRDVLEKDGVFPAGMIDNVIVQLKSFKDQNLSEKLSGDKDAIRELVLRYIHVK